MSSQKPNAVSPTMTKSYEDLAWEVWILSVCVFLQDCECLGVCLCPSDHYCGQLYMQGELSQLNDGAFQRVEAGGEDYDVLS